MTWIVATPTKLGCAVALSDIRVTWGSREEDCLLKIYPVGSELATIISGTAWRGTGPAVGFAGSVKIGFRMISELKGLIRERELWTQEEIADLCSKRSCEIFQNSLTQEKECGCALMLIGVLPTETTQRFPGWSLPNQPPRFVPKPFVCCFRNEKFEPEFAYDGEVASIGCGSSVEAYKKLLGNLSDQPSNPSFLRRAREADSVKLWLWFNVTSKSVEAPQPGISPHFHVCTAFADSVEIVGGHSIGPMPKVATSFEEFEQMANDFGLLACGAKC